MYQQLLTYLEQWSQTTSERAKLQHTYAVGGLALVVVAGIVGLVNYQLGQTLFMIAWVAIAIFFINAIVWALLTAFVILPLARRSPANAKIRSKKRT